MTELRVLVLDEITLSNEPWHGSGARRQRAARAAALVERLEQETLAQVFRGEL